MKKLALLIILSSSIYLQGCDFQGGLVRYADFESSINIYCVQKALDNTEGITNIKYSQPSGNAHRFDYEVEGISNFLQYQTASFNRIRYWNGYFFLNTIPKKEDIDKIRPYLIKIDKNIEKECHINLLEFIEEDCSRMKCN